MFAPRIQTHAGAKIMDGTWALYEGGTELCLELLTDFDSCLVRRKWEDLI